MTDDKHNKDLGLTYEQAMHGCQTAIKFRMSRDSNSGVPEHESFVGPKHMRVGVDSAHVSQLALAMLLMAKGLFTKAEYEESIRLAANIELYDWQERFGIKFL